MKITIRGHKNSSTLYLRARVDGKQVDFATGLKDTKRNRAYLSKNAETIFLDKYSKKYPDAKLPAQYQAVQTIESAPSSLKSGVTFAEYAEYILSITSNNLKDSSLEVYEKSIKALNAFFGEMDIKDIKASTIEEWQTQMLKHYAPATINRKYRVVLSKVLDYAEADEIISKNPLKRVKTLKVQKREINTYTAKEIQTLLSVCDEQFADFLRVAIFTGLRAGELIGLKWEHVDFDVKYITVKEQTITSGRNRGKTDTTKSSNARNVELLPLVFEALERQKRRTAIKSDYVFLNQYNQPYTNEGNIRRKLQKLLEKAGLKRGTLHDLRKTFATLMLQSGQSEAWLRQTIGHIDSSVTQKHYIGQLKVDVEKLNNILVS